MTPTKYFADEIGIATTSCKEKMKNLDVWLLITGIKTAKEVKVGDTITDAHCLRKCY